MYRRIRVHLPGTSTFVVGVDHGKVIEVSHEDFKSYLDGPDVVLADHLRNRGATFQDLADRTVVSLRRGYRSRADRQVVSKRRRGRSLEEVEGKSPYKTPKRSHKKPAAPYVENLTLESLLSFTDQTVVDVEIPDDIPF